MNIIGTGCLITYVMFFTKVKTYVCWSILFLEVNIVQGFYILLNKLPSTNKYVAYIDNVRLMVIMSLQKISHHLKQTFLNKNSTQFIKHNNINLAISKTCSRKVQKSR